MQETPFYVLKEQNLINIFQRALYNGIRDEFSVTKHVTNAYLGLKMF